MTVALTLVPIAVFGFVVLATNAAVFMLAGVESVPHDVQRILQVGLFASVAVVALLSSECRGATYETWLALPRTARAGILAFLVVGLVSSAVAAVPWAALREVAVFSLLVAVAVIVASSRRRCAGSFDQIALALLFLTAFLYSAIFLVLEVFVERGATMFGFSHPRFFGQVGLWILPFLVGGALVLRERTPVRVGLWATAIVWCALVLESASRAAIFGTLLGVAFVALVLWRQARRWAVGAGGVLVGGVALWILMFRVFTTPTSDLVGLGRVAAEITDDKARLFLWSDALRLFRESPLVGVGPEHYALHTHQVFAAHPHSAPMQLLAEWGLLATAIVVALGVWGTLRWFRAQREAPSTLADPVVIAALSGALVSGAFAATVDGIIVMPISQVMLAAVVGWMIGIYFPEKQAASSGRVGPIGFSLMPVAAVAIIAVTAIPYGLRPAQEVDRYVAEHPDGFLAPRFWQIGWMDR